MSRVLLTQGQFPEALLRPTVNYIARCQLSSGAIPWFPEGQDRPLGPPGERHGPRHRRRF